MDVYHSFFLNQRHACLKIHYLRHLHFMIRRLSSIITGLSLPLVADALDEVLVEVADVEVSHLQRY